jgi:hypothetical protein
LVIGVMSATRSAGPHGQQVLAHVRVDDDRIGRLARVLGTGQRAALQALLGVGRGRLVGGFRQAQALDADRQARRVHHAEHVAHALVGLADQGALGLVEVHDAGRGRLDAHLLLDRAAGNAVARAQAAVFLDQELGHDEQ